MGSGYFRCIVSCPRLFELVLNLRPQIRPCAFVVSFQVGNLALLHRFAWPCVDDQAGHAGDAIDVVSSGDLALGCLLA